MKYFNNDYETCGTAALKPQAGRELVLVQGGFRNGGSATGASDVSGRCTAPYGFSSVATGVIGFVCDAVDRIEPLPEPIAKPCEPTRAQELVGVVACLGCVLAVLLLSAFVQTLI